MNKDLVELIAVARRELRMAAGVPLTAQEQEQERLKIEVEELQKFFFAQVSIHLRIAILLRVVVYNGQAIPEFTVDEREFQLRPEGSDFLLFAVADKERGPLFKLKKDDPQFGNRLLVAIGDIFADESPS